MKIYSTEVVQPLGDHNPKYPCVRTAEVKQYLDIPYEFLNPLQSDFVKFLEDDDLNIVIAAPTSSGKTLCAELFTARAISLGKKVLYIAPMKALANEKYFEWTGKTFSARKIEILTGDFVLSDEKKTALEQANIIIMTPEMFSSKGRTFDAHAWLHNAWIVVDEVHLLGSISRGSAEEVGIVQYYENDSQARCMFLSATVPNAPDFGKWLEHLTKRKSEVIFSNYRPCKLNVNFDTFEDCSYGKRLFYDQIEAKRMDKVVELVKKYKEHPIIAFVGNKDFGAKLNKRLEIVGIKNYFHNADVEYGERLKIEEGFRKLDFSVLVASTTVAWGVNSPARYVIQSHTKYGLTEMEPADIWQAVGRAGRAGYANEGDAIIVVPQSDRKKEEDRIFKSYKIMSTLNDLNTLMFHVLSYISNGHIRNAKDLYTWYHKTLSSVQKNHITEALSQKVLDSLVARRMIFESEGVYEATKLGRITAHMYMSPLDVSDWYVNFSKLKELNPSKSTLPTLARDINLKVASAFAECYSWGLTWAAEGFQNKNSAVYITKREQASPLVIEVGKLLKKSVDSNPYLKYAAIFYARLVGKEIDPVLNNIYFNISKDMDRIISTLKQADAQSGKFLNNMGKCVGFGWTSEWDKLAMRIRYGVEEYLYELVEIDGIGPVLAEKLFAQKIKGKKDFMDIKNREVVKKTVGDKRFETICKNNGFEI